jgi:hypothetical protein
MTWDLLLVIPLVGAAVLLIVDLLRRAPWWVTWLGYGVCLLVAVGIVGRSQLAAMGPLEIVVTVAACFFTPLMRSIRPLIRRQK